MFIPLLLALSPAAPLPQDVVIDRIVVTGDPAPDGEGVFDRPVLGVVINEDGDVAFAARTVGSSQGILDDDILVLADADGWEILGREGEPAPDGDGVYGSFFPTNPYTACFTQPAFGDRGEALSVATFLGGAYSPWDTAVVSARRGQATQVLVREGNLVAGGQLQVAQLLVGLGSGTSAGEGALLVDVLEGEGGLRRGYWDFAAGSFSPILQVGDDVAPPDGEVVGFHEGWIALGERGTAAFVAGLEPLGLTATDGAVVRRRGGVLTVLAREGQPAPGGGLFGNLDLSAGSTRPVVNALDQVAFRASIKGTPPLFLETGGAIFLATPGAELLSVIREGDPSPDGDGTVEGLIGPNLSDRGHVTAIAVFEWGPESTSVDSGIVAGKPGALEVIARTGQSWPGGGESFANAWFPAQVNANGTVAFVGAGASTPTAGLFAKRPGQPLIEVVRPGDVLDGRVVSTVDFPATHDQGGHSVINDSDEIAFFVWFENGDTGVYVARLCQGDAPSGACTALDADPNAISLAAGGAAAMALDAGPSEAGALYLVVGSASGSTPGLATPAGTLPLNLPDPWFDFTLANPNVAPLSNTFGFLDGDGRATAGFALPPGLDPTLAGAILHHAFVLIDLGPPLAATFISNATPVTLLP